MADVKKGDKTSEHAVAVNASTWGGVATVFGLILSLGSTLLPVMGSNTRIGIIAGAVIALVGILQKTFVSLGYIKSRAEVKVAASAENK